MDFLIDMINDRISTFPDTDRFTQGDHALMEFIIFPLIVSLVTSIMAGLSGGNYWNYFVVIICLLAVGIICMVFYSGGIRKKLEYIEMREDIKEMRMKELMGKKKTKKLKRSSGLKQRGKKYNRMV